MNDTTINNFIRMHLDEGKPAAAVFHAFRNAFPSDVDGIKRAKLEERAKQLSEEREFLLATELGKRYYDLLSRRSRFMQDVLNWLEVRVEELQSIDPGTDTLAIDKQFTKCRTFAAMMTELDGNGKQTGAILKDLSNEFPEPLQKLAAELFPNEVPLR